MGLGSMDGGMAGMLGGESLNPILRLYLSLPAWGQAAVRTMLVISAAAFLGMILGKLYASVRYPDPDAHTAISPRLRILFLVILLICGIWLYRTITIQNEPSKPVSGGELFSTPEEQGSGGGGYGNIGGAVGGGMAVAIPG